MSRLYIPVLITAGTTAASFIMALGAAAPPVDRRVHFSLGVLILALITSAFAVAAWALLIRPGRSSNKVNLGAVGSVFGIGTATALVLSSIAAGIGTIWDEVWHQRYGIPFGPDLAWQPHLLIYFSLITTCLVGLRGLTEILATRGSLLQRFERDPVSGAAALLGLYTFFAVLADPIWHEIYGVDAVAWALPHLVMVALGFLLAAFSAMLVLEATSSRRHRWRGPLSIRLPDAAVAMTFTGAASGLVALLASDWYRPLYSSSAVGEVTLPPWLLTAFLSGVAALVGGSALVLTRRHGTGLMTIAIAMALRLALDRLFAGSPTGARAFVLVLPAALMVEAVFYLSAHRGRQSPGAIGMAVGGACSGVTVGIAAPSILPGLRVMTGELLQHALAGATAAVLGWLSVRALVAANPTTRIRRSELAPSTTRSSLRRAVGVATAFCAVVLLLLVTASPPSPPT